MSSAVVANIKTPFDLQINSDSLGKLYDMLVGEALIWKHGVSINIRIYLLRQQICQASARPHNLWSLNQNHNKAAPHAEHQP